MRNPPTKSQELGTASHFWRYLRVYFSTTAAKEATSLSKEKKETHEPKIKTKKKPHKNKKKRKQEARIQARGTALSATLVNCFFLLRTNTG